MRIEQKKYPAYTDTDFMPFGMHKGKPLQEVPAKYLMYLRDNGGTNDDKLNNYIHNSWDAIRMELKEVD